MGGHRQRRTQRQGSHECKQYKHLLPSPLSHACKAMVPPFQALRKALAPPYKLGSRPHQPRPLFAVVFLPSTIPSHAHHHGLACACSSHCWHCSAPAWCAQPLHSPSPARLLEQGGPTIIAHGHDAQPPSARPMQLMAHFPYTACASAPSSDARSPVQWAPSPAPFPSSASMVHHSGSVHTSAPIMPRVGRSKDAARDMVGLLTMRRQASCR